MSLARAAVALVLASCASAPSTPEELGVEVVGAMRAGDVAAFERLYWSPIAAGEVCEAEVGERLARERLRARQPFVACRRRIAWDDVRDVHVVGGMADKPHRSCGGRALDLTDVVVTLELAGADGPRYARFALEDALTFDERFHLGGDLDCREPPEGFAECRDLVRETTEISRRDIGEAYARQLEGALLAGCERLDAGPRAELATCVAGARDLGAVDACYMRAYDEPRESRMSSDPAAALPSSCERFIAAYERCVEQMPEAAREPARDAITQMRNAWSTAPNDALEGACRSAWDAAREGMRSICPGAGFEEVLP